MWKLNELAGASFPFLFGGTFIEGAKNLTDFNCDWNFPSFSEGLSLRGRRNYRDGWPSHSFPFLFGGTFIEGVGLVRARDSRNFGFPFLFGGTFIEGHKTPGPCLGIRGISLPFRRDFH